MSTVVSRVPIVIVALTALYQIAAGETLKFDLQSSEIRELPTRFQAFEHTRAGELYFASVGRVGPVEVTRYSKAGNRVSRAISDAQPADTPEVFADIAIGPNGSIYLPALWRGKSKEEVSFGALVYSGDGKPAESLHFRPPILVRRLAADERGNIYALGIDPAYFKHKSDHCALVHKYTPEGDRIASFSECPTEYDLRRSRDVRPGPDWTRLKTESDRGDVWISGALVYHVLPLSRRLRTFDPAGRLVREITFSAPDAAELLGSYGQTTRSSAGDTISKVLQRPDGSFLVQWLHAETRGAGRHHFPYVAVHDVAGKPLSRATTLPCRTCIPGWIDDSGNAFYLQKAAEGQQRILRFSVSVD